MSLKRKMLPVLILLVAMSCEGFSQITGEMAGARSSGYGFGSYPKLFIPTDTVKVHEGITIDTVSKKIFYWNGKWIPITKLTDSIPADTSSTRIPNINLRAAVKIIESLRIDSLIMSRDISKQLERIAARDNTIRALSERIETYKLLSTNYDKQIVNLNKQNDLATGLNKSLGKSMKRERTKTVIVGIAGIAATILAAVYIK